PGACPRRSALTGLCHNGPDQAHVSGGDHGRDIPTPSSRPASLAPCGPRYGRGHRLRPSLLVGDAAHRTRQPPPPPITGLDMSPKRAGNGLGRTGKAQQKGRKDPVCQRPLALVQQGSSEVVGGALTAMAPVAFASGTVLVRTPGANVVALAPRTLE